MPASTTLGRPVILGIVGDSAAGKTTLTDGIAQILGPARVATICTDDYHAFDRRERSEAGLSPLDPRCNYMDILEQHLKLLRQGQPILKPVYNHERGTLDRPAYVSPRPFLIVEGLLGYATRAMRDCYDVKVFLDPDPTLRMRWKVRRDTERRGYTQDEVVQALDRRRFDGPTYIEPQRVYADIVVNFFPPLEQIEESGRHLNVRHMLRPTLPHPDLTPILGQSARSGLHLELSRDTDGKPVDILEIAGAITERRALEVERLLWRLIPAGNQPDARLGTYDGQAISHPLALTQLFIAYHMMMAAEGIHAV